MANHSTFNLYTFIIGSDYHDTIHNIHAYTKAEALKEARKYKLLPTDHIRYCGKTVLEKWVNGRGWVSTSKVR